MPFPKQINFDIVAYGLLQDIAGAMKAWSTGRPCSEEAFMSQVTEHLARKRRGCDVGLTDPVGMRCQVAMLHRRGENQVDQYGCDLAVTIYVDSEQYMKTALFQLKKSQNYRASVERRQLDDAMADARTGERAFVLAIDEVRQGIRIESAATLLKQFSDQKSKTFEVAEWTSITQWVWNWFSCDIGPISDPTNLQSIEALLENYRVPDSDSWQSPWAVGEIAENDLPEQTPARAWLTFTFENQEPSRQR
jgi:hypothetical protein